MPFGLLSTVEVVEDSSKDWRKGVEYQPDVCDAALTVASVCVTGSGADKAPTSDGVPVFGADSFAVYSYIDCATVGWGDDLGRFREKSRRALLNGESRAVEATFWTGATSDGGVVLPHLAENTAVTGDGGVILQTAATVVTGGDVVESISALEEAMAECYGGTPTIHVPRGAIAPLADRMQLVERDGRLYTVGGSLVVAGGGYPGTSPSGGAPAAGTGWFYATGSVLVVRSPLLDWDPIPKNVVDREKNSVVLVTERRYLVTWDCCHFAALTDLGS